VVGPDDEFDEFTRESMREAAARLHNEPPVPSSNPIIRRLQRGSEWGPVANLTSPEAAVEWVRSRASIDMSRPSLKNLFRLKTDWRLTPESLPMLLDILSSEDGRLVFTALMALSRNGAQLSSDETETTDATVHRITLPDGSVHERPDNVRAL
jgi:hypothetical protein